MKHATRILSWISLLLFVFSLWGLQYLSLTPDNRVMMDPEDPRVVELLQFERDFVAQNVVGIVVSSGPGRHVDIHALGIKCRTGKRHPVFPAVEPAYPKLTL